MITQTLSRSEQRSEGCSVSGFRNGIALRGGLAIGELDEIELEDNTLDAQSWTARFGGLVGLGLVRAYQLESRCNWSGAILHPDLVAHLDDTVLSEHEEGSFTALDLCAAHLVWATEAPLKLDKPGSHVEITYARRWAINWPVMRKSPEWGLSEDQVASAFTSFGRTAPSSDVSPQRSETIAFMRRADADSAATYARRQGIPREGS